MLLSLGIVSPMARVSYNRIRERLLLGVLFLDFGKEKLGCRKQSLTRNFLIKKRNKEKPR